MSDVSWHTKSGEEVLSELDTPLGGLTSQEAENRLEKYGENKLREPDKVPAFIRFLSQYHDPLNYLLIGAGLLALATHPINLEMPYSSVLFSQQTHFSGFGRRTKQNKKWVL